MITDYDRISFIERYRINVSPNSGKWDLYRDDESLNAMIGIGSDQDLRKAIDSAIKDGNDTMERNRNILRECVTSGQITYSAAYSPELGQEPIKSKDSLVALLETMASNTAFSEQARKLLYQAAKEQANYDKDKAENSDS